MKISNLLRRFDAYPKTLEDFSIRTLAGAVVTVISTLLISILITLEFLAYLRPDLQEELFVDTSRGNLLRINIDFYIKNLACSYLSLDAMDSSGDQHIQIQHNIFKHRLDLDGKPIEEENQRPIKEIVLATSTDPKNTTCGSCYGAQQNNTQCCNTCESVLDAYRAKKWDVNIKNIEQCKGQEDKFKRHDKEAFKEGCRIEGHLEVNRMSGSFHIAPGASFSINQFHIHDFQVSDFKLTHTINHLSFGQKIDFANTHPLDGMVEEGDSSGKSQMFNYYLKIIPTTYVKKDGTTVTTNQFSVTRYKKIISAGRERGMPGLFFSYELSPLMVKYTEKSRSFGHFATNCCSIIGGVFTVAGIIAIFLHNSLEAIQKKVEVGKFS
ncbi:ERGIC3 family protein [Megaselia abdita]